MSVRYTPRLSPKKTYLQLAMNATLSEARAIIDILPINDRIIIEAGTPLIKRYGMRAIGELRALYGAHSAGGTTVSIAQLEELYTYGLIGKIAAGMIKVNSRQVPLGAPPPFTPYIVADLKTMDRGATEAELAAEAGASAAIALGSAPIETLNSFIAGCHENGIDAMIDMMNVEYPITVLRALKSPPDVVVLHRGVDEERDNKQKMLPLHEIRRIKGAYDVMIAVAGGDTPREVQSASFNDADIVVVWKSVYEKNEETLALVEGFLKTIR